MKNSRSRDSRGFSSLYVRASETVGTHLAHWPPPRFEREATPMRVKHEAGEPVKRAKPEPDIYIVAMERTGVSARDTVAVEDSVNGVRAAAGAGCRVIAITADSNAPVLLDAGSDTTIDSMSELPPAVGKLLKR